MITAVIVDDEAPARDRLRRLLASESDIMVVAEADSGARAIEAIGRTKPDLLFLDVQLPDMDGLDLLNALGNDVPEFVVFVTAYSEYALQAFEHEAVDYLLKPFDPDRFAESMMRVRRSIAQPPRSSAPPAFIDRIAVKAGNRVVLLKAVDIDWIEAEGNYVLIHAGAARYILREKIGTMEERLDPALFARIHRSTIVNMDRIRDLHPLFHGEYTVLLADGTKVTLSRRYKERLQTRWGRVL